MNRDHFQCGYQPLRRLVVVSIALRPSLLLLCAGIRLCRATGNRIRQAEMPKRQILRIGFVALVIAVAVARDAAGQPPLFHRIADTNTQLPEGQVGDMFNGFDVSKSSLSNGGGWAAFWASGVDSDTGPETGIYSNRDNHLGTVADTNDTFEGGQIANFNQPLMFGGNVYVSPSVFGPTDGIGRSAIDHNLSDIGGSAALTLVSGCDCSAYPLAYDDGVSINLRAPGGMGTPLISIGDPLPGGDVVSLGGFDYSNASPMTLLFAAEDDSFAGAMGLYRKTGGVPSTLADSTTEIPGTGENFAFFQAPILPGGNFQAAFVGGRGAIAAPDSIRGIYGIDGGGDIVTFAEKGQPAVFGALNLGNWVNFDPVLAPDEGFLFVSSAAPPPQFAFKGDTQTASGIFLVDAMTGDVSLAYLETFGFNAFRFQDAGSTEFFASLTEIGRHSMRNGNILVSGNVSEVDLSSENIETIFIIDANGAGFGFPGSRQDDPIMPNTVDPDGTAHFDDTPSGMWVDPPLVDGYTYEMTSDSLFVAVLDFPTGFAAAMEVFVEGASLGLFEPGDQLMFPGEGVGSFSVRGILPPDDLADGADFPLQIAFDDPTASFTMTPIPVPEPSSIVLLALAGLVLAVASRQRHSDFRRCQWRWRD